VHAHDSSEQIYVVVRGRGLMVVDDERNARSRPARQYWFPPAPSTRSRTSVWNRSSTSLRRRRLFRPRSTPTAGSRVTSGAPPTTPDQRDERVGYRFVGSERAYVVPSSTHLASW